MLIDRCIEQFINTIETVDDALSLNDGSHDIRRRLFLDSYPSIIIVLSTYLHLYDDPKARYTLKKYVLKEIIVLNNQKAIDLSLCYGLTGVAYSLKLAVQVLPELTTFLEQFDVLYTKLAKVQITRTNWVIQKRSVAEKDYDLIQGLTSCLGYLSQYGNSHGDLQNERLIVKLFDWLSQSSGVGLPHALIKNNNIIDSGRKRLFKEGYINLSLSHGLAGPLAALSGVSITRPLVSIMTLYARLFNENHHINSPWAGEISAQKLKKHLFSNQDIDRASWCYGNPGIARSVFRAAEKQKDYALEKVALDYFLSLQDLELSQLQLDSPTICHGVSGLLLILNAMERDTRMEKLGVIKKEITSYLLSQADLSSDLVFKEYDAVFREKKYDSPRYFNDTGLLNGAGGVVLTLMSLKSEQRLDWERILLIS